MLENFIYSKTRALFEAQLTAGNVLDEAIVFIEDTKEIWNHGTYFDCSTMDISHLATKAEIPIKTSQLTNDSGYITGIDKNVTYTGTLTDEQVAVFEGTTGQVKASGYTIAKSVPSNAVFTDTTYSSKAAASGGTDVSLVTTGEKATWNAKTSNTGTVTKVSAGTGLTGGDITTAGTIALATSGVTAGSAGPTAAVTGSEGATVSIPRITVDTYGRVTGLTSYNLTNKNTTYSAATTSANGLMSTTDKSRLDFMHSVTSRTTLASIPVTGAIVSATLSGATSLSLAGAMTVGQSVTVICTPSASFTQPLPTTGSFISMDGDSLSVTSGKVFEINILCYASGKYSISCKTAS